MTEKEFIGSVLVSFLEFWGVRSGKMSTKNKKISYLN
jgi:hypothetical protein